MIQNTINSSNQFTKTQRIKIWDNYVNFKIHQIYGISELLESDMDFSIMAPCPICSKIMMKSQYVSFQPNQKGSWLIVHWDNNRTNNELKNLVPIHVTCSEGKNNYFE